MKVEDRIPIELWGVVAGFLHPRDQRSLLFLSSTLRRAAQGHLFRQLDLYFGLWERVKPSDYAKTDDEDLNGESVLKNARRTTEILARINKDETFAHGVRSLRVMCYTNSGLTNEETQLLINGITAMPQLKRFEWLGIFPPLTHQAALASQLHVDNRDGYSSEIYKYRPDTQALINTNQNLIRLTIYSDLLEFLNAATFQRLVELEVWGPRNDHLAHIQNLIPCGKRLESLSLVELTGCNIVPPILFSSGDKFPHLTSLKIMSLDTVYHKDGAHALAAYVRSHPNLQRLDFDLPGLERPDVLLILEAVGGLTHLQVFGCDLRTITEVDDLAVLAQHLPLSLVAVHLQLCWENVSYTELLMKPILRRLRSMRHLWFLHAQSRCVSQQAEAEELAYTLTGLDHVGLVEQMFTVHRRQIDPTRRQIKLEPWPLRNVALRSAETIGQEGEWLLRFHNLLESPE